MGMVQVSEDVVMELLFFVPGFIIAVQLIVYFVESIRKATIK